MKKLTLLLVLILVFCSSPLVQYHAIFEGGLDPLFDIASVKSVGFVPNPAADELTEKQFFVYAREELQRRGVTVIYIPSKYIVNEDRTIDTDTDTLIVKDTFYIKKDFGEVPKLLLTVGYYQDLGNQIRVPGQSHGTINWWNSYGGGSYVSTEGYDVQTYLLVLSYTIINMDQQREKVWEGTLKMGSPKMNLFEEAPSMTQRIFMEKFDSNFIGNTLSRYYHRSDCRNAKTIRSENMVTFRSLEAARRAGYFACVCISQ